MTDAMRDMIAELMGTQREGEEGRDLPPYNHASVCRAYLIGCCPYELVPDSRLQGLLSCRRTHEPAHKADFDRAQAKKDHFYDVDAFDLLENAIRVVDGEVNRIKGKLDREAQEQTNNAEVIKIQRINELDSKIGKAVEEMEALGNLGKVEESMKLSQTVEELRQRKADLEAQGEMRLAGPGSNASRLRVCDDCGAQLNVLDHESRIADHFGGKMHLGMVEVREKYNELKEKIEDRRREKREKLGNDVIPPSRFGGSSDRRRSPPRRDRDGDRDRDRYGSSRRRSRSRSRDRRDSRDHRGSGGRGDRDRDRRDRRY